MIISRTPFRVSFLGGGSDLPAFFEASEGAVLTCTINKYMYITVNNRFDRSYRLAYSKTEICESVSQIDHKIFRTVLGRYENQILQKTGGKGLELLSMADIPAGTGLGSSSSFTVGLLHAVKGHLGQFQSAENLAAEACRIEIDELREPIGKQDQYAAAFGGLQFIRFLPSGQVTCDPVICSSEMRRGLEESMMLFYTGQTRSASAILSEQKSNTSKKKEVLQEMVRLAHQSRDVLQNSGASSDVSVGTDSDRSAKHVQQSLKKFGTLLNEGWELKKTLASGISMPEIDANYAKAMAAGAWGGKILGAGGGGFLLLLCPKESQENVRKSLAQLEQVPIELEPSGSKIIFVG